MIAIWGANGFIGRHVTKALLSAEEGLRLFARDFERFPFPLPETIQTFECDFTQPEDYIEHMKDCRVAVLLTSASLARTHADDPDQEKIGNIVPYEKFLERAEALPSLEHIIYASSGGAVYGVTENRPVSEDHIVNPISPYGKGKLVIENMIQEKASSLGLDYTILRIANPVGIWRQKNGFVEAALGAAKTGTVLEVYGDGSTVRDYFDVRELALAVDMVIEKPQARNQVFNVGSGKGYSVNDVVSIVEHATGKAIKIHYGDASGVDVPYNVLDCSKIENMIGWKAERDLKAIVKYMLEAKE